MANMLRKKASHTFGCCDHCARKKKAGNKARRVDPCRRLPRLPAGRRPHGGLMQSPPLELVLDVAHIATRNLLRNTGEPDDDTISEITRGVVYSRPWGPAAFIVAVLAAAVGFIAHILKPWPWKRLR